MSSERLLWRVHGSQRRPPALGGLRAYSSRLGEDRSPGNSRHSIASANELSPKRAFIGVLADRCERPMSAVGRTVGTGESDVLNHAAIDGALEDGT